MKPNNEITKREIRAFVHGYQNEGSPTCSCFGCSWARHFARKLGIKIETVRQWNARMAKESKGRKRGR